MCTSPITKQPNGPWTTQAASNFCTRTDRAIRFVIRDGAGRFTAGFDDVFRGEAATIIRTPPYTPVANAHAERWVGTSGANCATGPSSETTVSSNS